MREWQVEQQQRSLQAAAAANQLESQSMGRKVKLQFEIGLAEPHSTIAANTHNSLQTESLLSLFLSYGLNQTFNFKKLFIIFGQQDQTVHPMVEITHTYTCDRRSRRRTL